MKYHELRLQPRKKAKRAGRGISAGRGKTAGRGTKGQNARAGGRVRPGFEGGQNPLLQRIPKLAGFKSTRPEVETVYTGQLDVVKGTKIDNFSLYDANLVTSPYVKVKLIVKGDVHKKYNVILQSASQNAIEMIQKNGGTFSKVEQVQRQPKANT